MSTPGRTPDEWRLARFDERLLRELRARVGAQAAPPAPAARGERPAGRRRLARRGVLIPALAVVLVAGGAAALGGLVPGVSLQDPDRELQLRGFLANSAERTSVVVESGPGTAIPGSTWVDCGPAEPVAVCGTAGVSGGVRATASTRVFVRVSDQIRGVRADLAGVRAARSEGFIILSIPAGVLNAERPSSVALSFLGPSGQVIARRTVPLPPNPVTLSIPREARPTATTNQRRDSVSKLAATHHRRKQMTRRAGAALLAALALALIGAACTDDTADVAPAGQSLTAPGGRRHLSDLGPASNLAEPTQPGPSREATLGNLTRWAINNGALAQTFDPDTGITWILLPKGSALDIDDIPDNARGATEARITTARYAKKTYDAAEDAVMELVASGPGQGSYTWDLRIDAEVGALSVGTDAPAAVTAPLSERFGGAIVFQRTEGGSFLAGPRAARPVPDR